ncbi:xanthine dehydrogenase small subunit [Luteipulveratus halotolerans]|uniref:Dehydrogenase n=1 Tax=Luteipulveratus halotolerans TaxID=1631356 RepID=A0A0L6CE07_9MICO|nr:FAD binding domain-containing protein [Luteipulveratus halotolerans]KNX36027.1 dehydrogenase [Luteipulveratus halotolerans]
MSSTPRNGTVDGSVSLTVNGVATPLGEAPAYTTLLDWLRGQGLTGAKEGCAEGECGACSVMVVRPDGDDRSRWTAINACLVPAAAYAGQEVVTSEGLGTVDDLHPVQREMAVRGGSQCGYCTPGFVCSMAAEFYRPDRTRAAASPDGAADDGDHEHGPNGFDLHALSGNLCRCTGYRPIRDAAYALGDAAGDDPLAERTSRPAPAAEPLRHTAADRSFVRPADLDEALRLLADNPDAVALAGSTDWGVEVNIRSARADLVVVIDRLPELRELHVRDDVVEIGAALTLSEVERGLDGRVPLLDSLFPQFASRLIRNGATIGGNLGTGSPIGDTPPALLALEADLVLTSPDGDRVVPVSDYFTGYRESVRRPGELIRSVRVPLPLSQITAFHKIAKRRFDDISSVAVGFAIQTDGGVVSKARIGLGGVAATPIRATATEAALEGRPWSAETVAAAAAVMRGEGTPMDDHRASAAYRSAMLGTALRRLHSDNPTTEGRTA